MVLKFYMLAHLNPLHPAQRGSPEEASAIGTFILARHAAYRAVDGHSAVRGSTAEDVALAQRFRAHGFATLMTPGPDFVEADAYAGLDELWEGVGKNLFAVARGSWVTMLAVLAIEWFYGVVPVVLCVLPLLRRRRARAPMREQTAYWPVVVWLNRLAVSLVALPYGRYLRVLAVPPALRRAVSCLGCARLPLICGLGTEGERAPLDHVEGTDDRDVAN